jgi:hypothetical protein
MRKVEVFYSSEEYSCKNAVEVIGLQPSQDRLVWVMNKNFQLNENGVALQCSPFCWIEGHNTISHDVACTAKASSVPQCTLALTELVHSMKEVYKQNFIASLLMLGAQVRLFLIFTPPWQQLIFILGFVYTLRSCV